LAKTQGPTCLFTVVVRGAWPHGDKQTGKQKQTNPGDVLPYLDPYVRIVLACSLAFRTRLAFRMHNQSNPRLFNQITFRLEHIDSISKIKTSTSELFTAHVFNNILFSNAIVFSAIDLQPLVIWIAVVLMYRYIQSDTLYAFCVVFLAQMEVELCSKSMCLVLVQPCRTLACGGCRRRGRVESARESVWILTHPSEGPGAADVSTRAAAVRQSERRPGGGEKHRHKRSEFTVWTK